MPSAKNSNRSDHAELLRQLWEAAVNLRGSIGPAEYKQYVLPIIFLRFLSVRFEQRRERLQAEIAEPGSPLFAESEAERKLILEDEDSYRSAGVFPIPPVARWDYLRSQAQADDIKIKLDAALEALEDAYPQKLKGLLPRIFAGSNLAKDNVAGLINLFSKENFSADHGGADVLGKVYEYFIGEFADSEGRRGGEYFTPVSIVKSPSRIRDFQFDLPFLPEQRAIARILGALDDKTELNREMNRTLEATAQAIFRSWFVDFDPVVAKADGRKPFGMSDDLAALFPDRFVESELGPIPEGWEVSTIGAEVVAVGGSTPSTKDPRYWEEGEIH